MGHGVSSALVEQGVLDAVSRQCLGLFLLPFELGFAGGERDLVDSLDVGVDGEAIDRVEQVIEVLAPEAFERVDFGGPVLESVEETVSQAGIAEPTVAARCSRAAHVGLEDDHAATRVVLEGLQCRPKTGESTADDAEVGAERAMKRLSRAWCIGSVGPEHSRFRRRNERARIAHGRMT